MKTLVIVGVMATMLGFGMAALAADTDAVDFYAVSELVTGSSLQVMTDGQLTTVEGMSFKRHHDCGCDKKHGKSSWSFTSISQSNELSQLNLNFGGKRGGDVFQANEAMQSNRAIVR
jgi:hypothetical protein